MWAVILAIILACDAAKLSRARVAHRLSSACARLRGGDDFASIETAFRDARPTVYHESQAEEEDTEPTNFQEYQAKQLRQAMQDRQRIDELKQKIANANEDERPFLIYELAGLENKDAEFKGQKERERVRPVTSIEEDLRQEQEKKVNEDDLLVQPPAELSEPSGDQTEGLTDIEFSGRPLKKEWDVANKPLPPPEEDPPEFQPTELDKFADEMAQEEQAIDSDEYRENIQKMRKQQAKEPINYDDILDGPVPRIFRKHERKRGGKQLRARQSKAWKEEQNRQKNKARTDLMKIAKRAKTEETKRSLEPVLPIDSQIYRRGGDSDGV
uniref:Uncharacterized protein n=1 Tax=Lotharella oceanica TaxID=641309 RepID=A0A7S2XA18_9EUKA